MNPTLLKRSPARGLAALRRFTAARPAAERCELCSTVVSGQHQHLVDSDRRRLVCACDACAILFDHAGTARYRRVPRDIRALPGLEIGDALWNSLGIPIGLVFFFWSSVSKSVVAVYPSPGGPTETSVDEETWEEIAALHPSLRTLAHDVEALLVNRTKGARDCFIVAIDECYKLTGIIRSHWTGFSGGDAVWQEMRLFFEGLEQRALPERSVCA